MRGQPSRKPSILTVDAREATARHPTGKGRFARHLIRELERRGVPCRRLAGSGPLWHARTALRLRGDGDVGFYLSPTSFIVPALVGSRISCGIVVHDLVAFGNEPHAARSRWIERMTLGPALRTARAVFAVSETTRNDLLARFPRLDPDRVTVTYEGPTVEPGPAGTDRPEPTILHIGTLCPRKNQLGLIRAYLALPETLRSTYRLELVGGRGWQDRGIVELAQASPGVSWRGYLPDEELRETLARATVLAYPSLAEGFGLPVLDAMTLGVPVLTSNRSSMAEIAGDAARLVDPGSLDSLARGLEEILVREDLRRDLVARGRERARRFTWETAGDRVLEGLRRAGFDPGTC